MDSKLSVKPYGLDIEKALSVLGIKGNVWNFKNKGEQYKSPLKVNEYDPSMFKDSNEVKGTFGGYCFESECGNYRAITEFGIRGIGYKAVAVLFQGGVLVIH